MHNNKNSVGMILVAAVLVPGVRQAQGANGVDILSRPAPPTSAKAFEVYQVGREAQPINIDGRLDEAVWQQARFRRDFVQKEPTEGADPTLATAVAFAYDHEALYIAARMQGPRSELQRQMSRRDNTGNADRIKFSFDTYLDRRTAYTFGVTASGVRFDYYHASDSESDRDNTFDPVWEAATAIDADGWVAEMRIPFSQLRFNPSDAQTWGVNINRYIPGRDEDLYWVLVPRQETGWASRFGALQGIQGVAPTRRIEFLPYATSTATFTGGRDRANPFDDGRNLETRAGANFKLGLGPGLTLDATVNPDFGQVEADPAVVNLSAVETFFEERRPFFTEGAHFFQGEGADYYYSRRIGAPPYRAPGGDFVDVPKAAPIVGAAKISGRLPSGTSIGMLVAMTDRVFGRGYDIATADFTRGLAAPRTVFGVSRVRQEFGPDISTVGLTLTGMDRSLPANDPLTADLSRNAFTGGADWNLRFAGGRYVLEGAVGMSQVRGTPDAILRLQTSPRRYYQRPDQDYVHVDPSRTTLTGYQANLEFSKEGGRHWLYGVEASGETPGFEINDLGQLDRADELETSANVQFRETQPTRWLRSYSIGLEGSAGWNFGGASQGRDAALDLRAQFHNLMNASLGFEARPGFLSDELTRGGPVMKTVEETTVQGSVSNSYSASTQWNVSVTYGTAGLGGSRFETAARIEVRPFPRWQLSIRPSYARSVNARQYITQRAGRRPEVFGGRYVFGRIDRHTLSAQVRLSYAFTPDLTLELYAEPFAGSGQYSGIGELRAARTHDLRLYGEGGTTLTRDEANGTITVADGADQFTFRDPDFHVLSFRSNAVLRWEWRPGSTLYLVWQQNRDDDGDLRRATDAGDFLDSLGGRGDNFVALKVSYLFQGS